MKLLIPVTDDGMVDPKFGRARKVAVAVVEDAVISEWTVVEVNWDESHGDKCSPDHHARIAAFLKQNDIQGVLATHMGEPMRHVITKMGIALLPPKSADAQASVQMATESK